MGGIWNKDKLIRKDICFECGSNLNINYHHIIPETLGGHETIPLCEKCHGMVHGKDLSKMFTLARIGREKYLLNGGKFGRLSGSTEDEETFLNKEKIKEIIKLLDDSKTVRIISKLTKCSFKTIIKVRQILAKRKLYS